MSNREKQESPPPAPGEGVRRILGLDGSTVASGWGIIDEHPAATGRRGARPRVELVAFGVFEVRKSIQRLDRLVAMAARLRALIGMYKPAEVAIEEAFSFRNPRVTMSLSELRGVLMLVAREAGLRVAEFPPRTVKQHIAGRGSASKEEVAEAVRMRLGLDRAERPLDATDALACALCHQAESAGHALRQGTLASGAYRTGRRKSKRPEQIATTWRLSRRR